MKTIVNRTHRPLRVPLGQGRVLHLNPGHEGQIATGDADYPQLLAMVERGEVAILDGSESPEPDATFGRGGRVETHGHHPDTSTHRRGDR